MKAHSEIHPTTVAYGIMAQEFFDTMQHAGVKYYRGDGVTERVGPGQWPTNARELDENSKESFSHLCVDIDSMA